MSNLLMNKDQILRSNDKKAELIRFIAVGGFATVLQYGMYIVFLMAVGTTPVVSTLISYAISFIANFFLSSYFTFRSNPNAKKGLAFTMSHLINMGMQTGLVAIFTGLVAIFKGVVGLILALLPALAICVPVNFILVRYAFTAKIFQGSIKKKKV